MKLGFGAKSILVPKFQRRSPYEYRRESQWRAEAGDRKTPPVFARNVDAVIALAESRDQPFLLLTYAYYIPDDHSNERFHARELDYSFTHGTLRTKRRSRINPGRVG